MARRNILLGGSGYLGRHLARRLAAAGEETAAVVRSEAAARRVRDASPETVTLDEADLGGLRFDRLFNLIVDYGRGGAPLSEAVEINHQIPMRLVEKIDCAELFNISTALPEAYSRYSWSKRMLERSLAFHGQQTGKRVRNLRLHNFYGPGADPSNFIAFVAGKLVRGEALELGPCENARDFIHVDDLTDLLLLLGDRTGALASGEALEVGSGIAVRLKDLVLQLRDLTGSDAPLHFGARPSPPGELPVMVADAAPLAALGWHPRIALEDGLAAVVGELRAAQPR